MSRYQFSGMVGSLDIQTDSFDPEDVRFHKMVVRAREYINYDLFEGLVKAIESNGDTPQKVAAIAVATAHASCCLSAAILNTLASDRGHTVSSGPQELYVDGQIIPPNTQMWPGTFMRAAYNNLFQGLIDCYNKDADDDERIEEELESDQPDEEKWDL